MKNKKFGVRNLTLCALFAALTAIGAFIRIDIPVLPFTLQVMFVISAGLILGPRDGAISMLIYIAIGLIGLPIFSQGGGPAYVLHPTFGYLIGFVAGSFVTGKIVQGQIRPSYPRLLIAAFTGLFILYGFGMIYYFFISNFYLTNPISVGGLFIYLLLPVLPGNALEMLLAVAVARRIIPMYYKMQNRGVTQKG